MNTDDFDPHSVNTAQNDCIPQFPCATEQLIVSMISNSSATSPFSSNAGLINNSNNIRQPRNTDAAFGAWFGC
jgi:hypothetical protein